ncbi:MAG: nucleoside hydrolase [Thermomicrobiales bacterium]
MTRIHPTIVDTDIGSDVDDILALALLARAPEVRLIGVTTVYGNTLLRAQIARWVCDRLGRADVAVIPGRQETLTGREIWWPGHEGVGIADLEETPVATEQTAVDYLCQTAQEHAGELDLIAIGPLTNVAAAIQADPAFASRLHHLYIMGGVFWQARGEHNFVCDPEAAEIVMRSGVPMSVCGLDVTKQVWLDEQDVVALAASRNPVGATLADQVRRWWVVRERAQDNPHDALAALMPIRPDLFTFTACDVTIAQDDAHLGWAMTSNCGHGAARLASGVNVALAQQEILRRLMHEAPASGESSA